MKLYIKLITLLFLSTVTLISCSQHDSKNTNEHTITIDIDKENSISIFDLFEKIEIIPLETIDASLIRYIDKLIYYNNTFYIHDKKEAKIFAFDTDGKFRFKIDDKGIGPEQYVAIADFDIDKENGILSFISPETTELHEYDLSGQFIQKHKLPQIISAYCFIKHLDKKTLAFWTFDYNNMLKFYSKENNKIFNECFPEEEDNIFGQIHTPVFPYGNYLVRTINNDVYEILPNGEIRVAYTWDFGKQNIKPQKLDPPSFRQMNNKELINYMKRISASEVINYIFLSSGGNNKYIYSQILRKDKYKNIFHNKNKNQTFIFEKTTENLSIHPVYWTDEFLIGCIPEELLIEKEFDTIIPDFILDPQNLKKKNQYEETDNPILIKYYFKK